MSTPPSSLRSQLLIASPTLHDPNFRQTVVLLVEHGESGALGIVLNRPLDRSIDELWKQISDSSTDCQAPVYWGGPVAGPLMVIHRFEDLSDWKVAPGVYFSTNKESIDAVMQRSGDDLRFFVGCAGWSAGQLESEIEEGAWDLISADEVSVFDGASELWTKLAQANGLAPGLDYPGVKHVPDDPSLN